MQQKLIFEFNGSNVRPEAEIREYILSGGIFVEGRH